MDVVRARRAAGAAVVDSFFRGLAYTTAANPASYPSLHGLQRLRNVRYAESSDRSHLLDVWYAENAPRPMPVVVYFHGGGFRILSKESHWLMALAFARRGYLVFNVDYRKAPRHVFPAAHEDALWAYRWVVENAAAFGGDPTKIIVAGESAGANLATAVALASCYERPEPAARAVFELDAVPAAALPACGLLQVTDTDRFARRRKLPVWLHDRLAEIEDAYVREASPHVDGGFDLADPLVVVERQARPQRPLPPFFMTVGTKDPLLDDTRRFAAALEGLGVDHRALYYPGEPHAFQAFLWRAQARQSWVETWRFLRDRGLLPERER